MTTISRDITYFCSSCGQQIYMFENLWTCVNPNCFVNNQSQTFTPRKCLKHNYSFDTFGQCPYCQGEHFWNKEDNPNTKQCEKHGMFYLGECGMCMNEAVDTTKETKEQVMSIMNNNNQRKYLPTIAELLDRITIVQQKELKIPEHREEYTKELNDLLYDLKLCLEEEGNKTAEQLTNILRDTIVLTLMNCHIWFSESNFRKGIKDGNNLELTHGLNGVRNTAKNKIQEQFSGRKDYKIDNVEAFKDWIPSGYEKES